jgi:hypothetical protein
MAVSGADVTSGCTTATLTRVSDAAAGRMRRLRLEWQTIQRGRTSGPRVPNTDVIPGFWDGAVGGWSAAPYVNEAGEEDIMNWNVKIYGPAGTPYQGGTFCCQFKFPERYPFHAPIVRFKTYIFHPNPSLAVGEPVYLPILEHCWSPAKCVPHVILAIIACAAAAVAPRLLDVHLGYSPGACRWRTPAHIGALGRRASLEAVLRARSMAALGDVLMAPLAFVAIVEKSLTSTAATSRARISSGVASRRLFAGASAFAEIKTRRSRDVLRGF